VADSPYFGPERSGVRWLLDPSAPGLAGLARAVQARTEDTECEPEAVAADLAMLPELLRDRHFGLATGLVAQGAADKSERLIRAARDRVLALRPRTWGEALGDLNDELRLCLRDRHVALRGSGRSRIRSDEPAAAVDQGAPAVEVDDRHGVLCVTLRRFFGGAEDDKLLWEWARDSLSHFSYDRIVVDLRGNEGGNDAIMLEWIVPVLQAGVRIPGTSAGWVVGEAPLGLWNPAALIEARDGRDAVPSWHLGHRHVPSPGDVLQVRTEGDEDPLPAGVRPWDGKMLVLVDAQTKSSGESAAWMLRHGVRGVLIGGRTAGMIEYGNIVPYLLPASGLHIGLTTKHNDYGAPIELVGLPVQAELDPATPLRTVAHSFDRLHGSAARS
jgi:Peptidase family S41